MNLNTLYEIATKWNDFFDQAGILRRLYETFILIFSIAVPQWLHVCLVNEFPISFIYG
jgi:hypothetical protein